MNLSFNEKLASEYKSPSQRARVLTEAWVDTQSYCPNCGHFEIDKYPNNRKAADFVCENCAEDYELKSKKDSFGSKVVDGAYDVLNNKISSGLNPNFFFLNYIDSAIANFFVVPKHFFVPEILEKRKPLGPSARRAGWIGCNILFNMIPEAGKIFIVKDNKAQEKKAVLTQWQKTLFLREEKEISAKGWLLDIMNCIERLEKKEFNLGDVYAFEEDLSEKHPDNKHIQAKIRQQLQILRDQGYIQFLGNGKYKLN